MSGFKHLGDELIASGYRINLVKATFEAPDGTVFERDVVRDKRVVAVVPVLDDLQTVLLVRQYRGPVDRELVEIPAGLCDVEGEDDPEVTANRELVEEIGRSAGKLQLLATINQSAGISDEHALIYLGTDLVEAPLDRQGIEEAYMTVEEFDLGRLDHAIATAELTDVKTIVGLMRARDVLHRGVDPNP
ncbi:MAG: NUDIX hydrolase [Acidimicrobiales bacterium]|nr:NUDIX hydrolase [Acidimicrobiales bacterium]